jgi:hypothetical protein
VSPRPAPTLPQKILAIHGALGAVPHAFGGALALAYWAEPRATVDVDVNVFVTTEQADDVLAPLAGLGVDVSGAADVVSAEGQVRVRWGTTPIDLFFSYHPFHEAARRGAVDQPFADRTIPVLSAAHLIVCKVVFDRAKDWVDIDTILALGTPVDTAEVLRWVGRLVGDDDPRYDRIARVLTSQR